MHRYQETRLLRAVVEYLETVDLPGAQKKLIATTVVKVLSKATGAKWEKELERAVEGAIEYVLAEVREDARDFYPDAAQVPAPAPEPPIMDNYGVWVAGDLPDDGALLEMGFRQGDQKWTTKNYSDWTVLKPGGSLDAGAYNFEGLIGTWIG